MGKVRFTLETDQAKAVQGILKATDALKKSEEGFKQSTGAARRQDKAVEGVVKQFKGLATGLIGGAGVLGALNLVSAAFETMLKNLREISAEAGKASREIVSFAALQAGGTKAQSVRRASDLAARFGIADRGVAFDTVQAIQSARGGSLEAGLSGARTVFAATQVGIPLESARELEVLGASQGQKPGQALRRAFVSGQASSRDPATLARAGAALQFFDDKDFGFAAGGVLAGSVRPEQLETFLKAGGIGLSGVSTLAPTFSRLGLAKDASQSDRLRALAGAGIDTPEKLKAAGLGEIRQQQALSTLVQNVGEVERIQGVVGREAVAGVLSRSRADVERELPTTFQSRVIDSLQVQLADARAFGPDVDRANKRRILDLAEATAAQNLGITQVGPFAADAFDEEGNPSLSFRLFGPSRSQLREDRNGFTRSELSPFGQEVKRVLDVAANLDEAAANLNSATRRVNTNTHTE